LSRLIKNLRFKIGCIIGNNPYFFPLFYLSESRKKSIIRSDTEICIEGFQRSGNTFFNFSFRRWNRNSKRAHHLHAAGQVVKAVGLGIPTIVLIRKPIDAVSSLLIKDLNLDIGNALESYTGFYNKLKPYRDNFIIGKFEDVIDQPGSLINRINEKFDTNFECDILSDDAKENFKLLIHKSNLKRKKTSTWERSSVPSEAKDSAKNRVKNSIENHPYFAQALKTYNSFLED